MKICIVGAGSIGGYLAVCLARARNQITVIARGAHLAAIRQRGIRLISADGEETNEVGRRMIEVALQLEVEEYASRHQGEGDAVGHAVVARNGTVRPGTITTGRRPDAGGARRSLARRRRGRDRAHTRWAAARRSGAARDHTCAAGAQPLGLARRELALGGFPTPRRNRSSASCRR